MANKGKWRVVVRCEVEKVIHCENCTEQEALEDPLDYMTEERELCQIDCNVLSIEPWD